MDMRQRFDPSKAIEAILYIARQQSNMYTLLKLLYFADKIHLGRYGRFICGDTYVAMRRGPVPSGVYDIIKYARGDGWFCFEPVEEAFRLKGHEIVPLRPVEARLLSESEIECLDEAIAEYGHRSFAELQKLSHDAAYQASDMNDFMSIVEIARTLADGELLIEHLRDA